MKQILIVSVVLLILINESHAAYDNVTTFYVYTQMNSNSPQIIINNDITSLKASYYNASIPTKFFIHGYVSNKDEYQAQGIKNSFLTKNVNVILVGWDGGSNLLDIPFKRPNVYSVGVQVAQFINFLIINGNLSVSMLNMVGLGPGAHICGIAGKNMNAKPKSILGLDPDLPSWSESYTEDRLNINDANYVEIWHTNMYIKGIYWTTANSDIIFNDGTFQPSCNQLDPFSTFSHNVGAKFYAECLINSVAFCAKHTNGSTVYVCGEPFSASGVYNVKTKDCAAYSTGTC